MAQRNADEPLDYDTSTVVSLAITEERTNTHSMQITESDEKVVDNVTPTKEEPPQGITDQTHFLPTRQVITVFLGLSVALACSFLDQTMYVFCLPSTHQLC